MKIGIEIPLETDMPLPELIPSPVAGDDGSDNFLGLFYRVDLEALEEWANVTNFVMGALGFSVEEPEITTNFRDIPPDYVWEHLGKNNSSLHHNGNRAVESSNERLL